MSENDFSHQNAEFQPFSGLKMSEAFDAFVEVIGGLEEHKRYAEDVAKLAAVSNSSLDRAVKLWNCGTYVALQQQDGYTRVVGSNFCRQRICPMCAWRRSLRMYVHMQDVVHTLEEYDYILCTLTVPNVAGDQIGDALNRMYKQFREMVKLPDFRAWDGYFRSTEVTYNRDFNTFHPHLHILVAVRPQYFSGRAYVSAAKLRQLWQIGQQIDLRRVRDVNRGVAEVVKYACKPLEFPTDLRLQERNAAALDALRVGLHGRRLVQTGGVIRAALHRLRVDLDADDTEGIEDVTAPLLALSWDTAARRYRRNEHSRGV